MYIHLVLTFNCPERVGIYSWLFQGSIPSADTMWLFIIFSEILSLNLSTFVVTTRYISSFPCRLFNSSWYGRSRSEACTRHISPHFSNLPPKKKKLFLSSNNNNIQSTLSLSFFYIIISPRMRLFILYGHQYNKSYYFLLLI